MSGTFLEFSGSLLTYIDLKIILSLQESDPHILVPSSSVVTILEPPSDEETVDDTRVQCHFCSKRFKNNKSMLDHRVRIHTNHTKEIHPCKFCDKTFSSIHELVNHEEDHGFKKNVKKFGKREMPQISQNGLAEVKTNIVTTDVHNSTSESQVEINSVHNIIFSTECKRNGTKTSGQRTSHLPYIEQVQSFKYEKYNITKTFKE